MVMVMIGCWFLSLWSVWMVVFKVLELEGYIEGMEDV